MKNEKIINKNKKIIIGKVISKKMQKTATVEVTRTYSHKLVGKIMKSKKKYHVHDEKEECSVGDMVEIYEGRPISKTKYMYLNQIISNNTVV